MRNFLDDESEERSDEDPLTETDSRQLGVIGRTFFEMHCLAGKLQNVQTYGAAALVLDTIDTRLQQLEKDLEEAKRG